VLAPLFVFVPQVSAAVRTWDGEGADNNWSTAANWSADTAPVNGDSVAFDRNMLTASEALNNDISSLSLAGINVTGNSTHDFFLTGNPITLTGDYLVSDYPSQANMDIIIGASGVRIQNVYSSGDLTIGSNATTLESVYFYGAVSGSGTLTFDQPSGDSGAGAGCSSGASTVQYPFLGDNSGFSGAISLTGYASLSIPAIASTVAMHASSITVGPNATLTFGLTNNQDFTFSKPITLNGGTIFASQNADDVSCEVTTNIKTLTLSGSINATAPSKVIMNYANVNMTGTVTGASNISVPEGYSAEEKLTIGTIVKQSAEKVTIYTGNQSATNPYASENNVLVVSEGATLGSVIVGGGTLKGKGTVGALSMSKGTVAPGLSPGCLTSGNLSYTGGSVEIEIDGSTACTQYDQQIVNGTVELGTATGLTIRRLSSYAPAVGTKFVIIANDGTDPVTGEFSVYTEGYPITLDGVTYNISYKGGDGNDVELTVTATLPAAADTGRGPVLTSPYVAIIAAVLALTAIGANRYIETRKK
jgi:hypothetical protein